MDSSDAVFFLDSLLCELLASSLVGLSWISSGDWDPHSIVSLVIGLINPTVHVQN